MKYTKASDDKYDRKHGIKEGSKADIALDKKRGIKDAGKEHKISRKVVATAGKPGKVGKAKPIAKRNARISSAANTPQGRIGTPFK